MFRSRDQRLPGFFRFLFSFLPILLFISLSVFYMDRIAAFAVNHFTGYSLTYDRWGNPFDRREIDGLVIEERGKRVGVRAEKTRLGFMIRRSIEQKGLLLRCEMEGVSFGVKKQNNPPPSSTGNILEFPFSPEHEYERISFTAYLNRKTIKISDFEAYSKNIRMYGDCVFLRDKDNITLDLKILFSPEIYGSFPEDIREGTLSLDDDGWYGTVISYQGNVIMLRALFSLTAVSDHRKNEDE